MNTVTEEDEESAESTPVKVVRVMPLKQAPKPKNLLIQAQ